MLRRAEGATVDEVASATGWQRHTVRGVFSGTLKKKLGLTLASAKEERGRVYRIAEPASAMKPPIHDASGPSPVEAATGPTDRAGRTSPRSTAKSPNWWIGRRTNCGLPGGSCIAPDRLSGSVAIC